MPGTEEQDSALAALDSYCVQQTGLPNSRYCESAANRCQPKSLRCTDRPFLSSPDLPSQGLCLREAIDFCTNYSIPEQVAACQNGALYAQRPRLLLTDKTLRDMSLFPDAFLKGMVKAKTCYSAPAQCPHGFFCVGNICTASGACTTNKDCYANHECSSGICKPMDICKSGHSIDGHVYVHDCTPSNLLDNVCECKLGATVASDGISYIHPDIPPSKDIADAYPSFTVIDIAWQGSFPIYVCPGTWTKNEADSHFGRSSFVCT